MFSILPNPHDEVRKWALLRLMPLKAILLSIEIIQEVLEEHFSGHL